MPRRAAGSEPQPVPVIPRYEYPGRIVLAVGWFMSWWCVVGLIVLELGGWGLD